MYSVLLTYAQIKNSGSGNCSALYQISILQYTSAVKRINVITRNMDQNTMNNNESNSIENIDFAELIFQSLVRK